MSKPYENMIYYIPFGAPRLALQHGIFGFSILNESPYATGSLVAFCEAARRNMKRTE
jgi:hypothetical protein